MPESRVRVLIVNPKLNQAVGIKNALEAVGGFEARPFTSPANALEFARVTPPDAAVLDIVEMIDDTNPSHLIGGSGSMTPRIEPRSP